MIGGTDLRLLCLAMEQLPDRLHLGCGLTTPPGWLNVDGSWNARLAKMPRLRALLCKLRIIPAANAEIPLNRDIFVHDLTRSLPFPDNMFTAVYASHVLEHLYLEDGKEMLRESFRVLRPGGVVRMVVPDLRPIVLEYTGGFSFGEDRAYGYITPEFKRTRPKADVLNTRLLLRDEAAPEGSVLFRAYQLMKNMRLHKWMYDAESLVYHIRDAGFVDVEPKGLHESRIPGIQEVEQPIRVERGVGVCVEGVKPRA